MQVLSMDDSGNTRARVKDQVSRQYDYSDAIRDMKAAAEAVQAAALKVAEADNKFS